MSRRFASVFRAVFCAMGSQGFQSGSGRRLSLRGMAQSAEAQSKITAEEREAFCESYQSALDSYTYLED